MSDSDEILPFVKHAYTMNCDTGDGFTCIACGHWIVYTNKTEWGDYFSIKSKRFGHIHGTEPFHYCPNCGAMVLTPMQWVDHYPQDAGKTFSEIERRFYSQEIK